MFDMKTQTITAGKLHQFNFKINSSSLFSGITLNKMSAYTVNSNGQRTFIDRTIKKNKDDPMRKKLILRDFSVYWYPKSKSLLYGNKSRILQNMLQGIYKTSQKG